MRQPCACLSPPGGVSLPLCASHTRGEEGQRKGQMADEQTLERPKERVRATTTLDGSCHQKNQKPKTTKTQLQCLSICSVCLKRYAIGIQPQGTYTWSEAYLGTYQGCLRILGGWHRGDSVRTQSDGFAAFAGEQRNKSKQNKTKQNKTKQNKKKQRA
jgi:hypothetical protein